MIAKLENTGAGTIGPLHTDGGPIWIQALGTFGGGTITVDIDELGRGEAADFVPYDSITTNTQKMYQDIPQGARLRATLAGATSVTFGFNGGVSTL